jgi:hypothetical protein
MITRESNVNTDRVYERYRLPACNWYKCESMDSIHILYLNFSEGPTPLKRAMWRHYSNAKSFLSHIKVDATVRVFLAFNF